MSADGMPLKVDLDPRDPDLNIVIETSREHGDASVIPKDRGIEANTVMGQTLSFEERVAALSRFVAPKMENRDQK